MYLIWVHVNKKPSLQCALSVVCAVSGQALLLRFALCLLLLRWPGLGVLSLGLEPSGPDGGAAALTTRPRRHMC